MTAARFPTSMSMFSHYPTNNNNNNHTAKETFSVSPVAADEKPVKRKGRRASSANLLNTVGGKLLHLQAAVIQKTTQGHRQLSPPPKSRSRRSKSRDRKSTRSKSRDRKSTTGRSKSRTRSKSRDRKRSASIDVFGRKSSSRKGLLSRGQSSDRSLLGSQKSLLHNNNHNNNKSSNSKKKTDRESLLVEAAHREAHDKLHVLLHDAKEHDHAFDANFEQAMITPAAPAKDSVQQLVLGGGFMLQQDNASSSVHHRTMDAMDNNNNNNNNTNVFEQVFAKDLDTTRSPRPDLLMRQHATRLSLQETSNKKGNKSSRQRSASATGRKRSQSATRRGRPNMQRTQSVRDHGATSKMTLQPGRRVGLQRSMSVQLQSGASVCSTTGKPSSSTKQRSASRQPKSRNKDMSQSARSHTTTNSTRRAPSKDPTTKKQQRSASTSAKKKKSRSASQSRDPKATAKMIHPIERSQTAPPEQLQKQKQHLDKRRKGLQDHLMMKKQMSMSTLGARSGASVGGTSVSRRKTGGGLGGHLQKHKSARTINTGGSASVGGHFRGGKKVPSSSSSSVQSSSAGNSTATTVRNNGSSTSKSSSSTSGGGISRKDALLASHFSKSLSSIKVPKMSGAVTLGELPTKSLRLSRSISDESSIAESTSSKKSSVKSHRKTQSTSLATVGENIATVGETRSLRLSRTISDDSSAAGSSRPQSLKGQRKTQSTRNLATVKESAPTTTTSNLATVKESKSLRATRTISDDSSATGSSRPQSLKGQRKTQSTRNLATVKETVPATTSNLGMVGESRSVRTTRTISHDSTANDSRQQSLKGQRKTQSTRNLHHCATAFAVPRAVGDTKKKLMKRSTSDRKIGLAGHLQKQSSMSKFRDGAASVSSMPLSRPVRQSSNASSAADESLKPKRSSLKNPLAKSGSNSKLLSSPDKLDTVVDSNDSKNASDAAAAAAGNRNFSKPLSNLYSNALTNSFTLHDSTVIASSQAVTTEALPEEHKTVQDAPKRAVSFSGPPPETPVAKVAKDTEWEAPTSFARQYPLETPVGGSTNHLEWDAAANFSRLPFETPLGGSTKDLEWDAAANFSRLPFETPVQGFNTARESEWEAPATYSDLTGSKQRRHTFAGHASWTPGSFPKVEDLMSDSDSEDDEDSLGELEPEIKTKHGKSRTKKSSGHASMSDLSVSPLELLSVPYALDDFSNHSPNLSLSEHESSMSTFESKPTSTAAGSKGSSKSSLLQGSKSSLTQGSKSSLTHIPRGKFRQGDKKASATQVRPRRSKSAPDEHVMEELGLSASSFGGGDSRPKRPSRVESLDSKKVAELFDYFEEEKEDEVVVPVDSRPKLPNRVDSVDAKKAAAEIFVGEEDRVTTAYDFSDEVSELSFPIAGDSRPRRPSRVQSLDSKKVVLLFAQEDTQ